MSLAIFGQQKLMMTIAVMHTALGLTMKKVYGILFPIAGMVSPFAPWHHEGLAGEKARSDRDSDGMQQGTRGRVTNLPRPWQIVAAGGAMSCGGRANILQRPLQKINPWHFGVVLQDAAIAFSKCKDTKSREQNKINSIIFLPRRSIFATFVAKIRKKTRKCKKKRIYFLMNFTQK